jgi:energy-coupling factor transporter ATP-binding protein EcfA2
LIRSGAENSLAEEWAARLQLKYHRLGDSVGTLSGGNQQKVVLGKWLATSPKVLIVDEPTRGIDVGTKSEVHRLMSELAGQGVAVLMISSELPEVLGMADRVLRHARGPPHRRAVARRGRRGERDPARDRPAKAEAGVSAATAAVEGERARRLVERVFRIRELGIVVALALLIAVTGDPRAALPRDRLAAQPRAQRVDLRDPRGRPDARDRSRATSTSRSARCSGSAPTSPATCSPSIPAWRCRCVPAGDRDGRGVRAAQRLPRRPGARCPRSS